ncbi:hypothetical protein EW146_g2893 [Bondarzewia mesenterica]|uniref:Uncharacterized protein n=1 Tax=Bondarzewia mesenterica TaxID=1095465 RepID=A0A4S4LZJ1_9AGAM|nr:hypothetical protein EW146_g2893 [Bondarzewia mesenterica]
MESFMARVEDVAQKRLDTDSKLHYMPSESIHRELLQELDRYPILERALVDMHALSDPALSANIQKSALTILRQDRGESAKGEKLISSDRTERKFVLGKIDGDEETALAPIPPVQESDVPSASLEPAPTLPKVNGIERAQSVVSEQPPEEMDITTD